MAKSAPAAAGKMAAWSLALHEASAPHVTDCIAHAALIATAIHCHWQRPFRRVSIKVNMCVCMVDCPLEAALPPTATGTVCRTGYFNCSYLFGTSRTPSHNIYQRTRAPTRTRNVRVMITLSSTVHQLAPVTSGVYERRRVNVKKLSFESKTVVNIF